MSWAWPHGDPRDVTRAIVGDPHYELRAMPAAPQSTWLDVIEDSIARAVRVLLHGIDHALGAHNSLEAAIGFAVIGLAIVCFGWGCFILVRSFLGVRARPRDRAVPAATPELQRSAGLRAAALAAARAGRFREAAALLFLAAVRGLDERGRLAYDPARTPSEYRRLVRDPQFDLLTEAAVVALFARAEPHDDLFERMSGAYDRFFEPLVR